MVNVMVNLMMNLIMNPMMNLMMPLVMNLVMYVMMNLMMTLMMERVMTPMVNLDDESDDDDADDDGSDDDDGDFQFLPGPRSSAKCKRRATCRAMGALVSWLVPGTRRLHALQTMMALWARSITRDKQIPSHAHQGLPPRSALMGQAGAVASAAVPTSA